MTKSTAPNFANRAATSAGCASFGTRLTNSERGASSRPAVLAVSLAWRRLFGSSTAPSSACGGGSALCEAGGRHAGSGAASGSSGTGGCVARSCASCARAAWLRMRHISTSARSASISLRHVGAAPPGASASRSAAMRISGSRRRCSSVGLLSAISTPDAACSPASCSVRQRRSRDAWATTSAVAVDAPDHCAPQPRRGVASRPSTLSGSGGGARPAAGWCGEPVAAGGAPPPLLICALASGSAAGACVHDTSSKTTATSADSSSPLSTLLHIDASARSSEASLK